MPSELQPPLARAVGERLDASVIQVAAAVEDDRFDPAFLCGGRKLLADRLGLSALVALEALEPDPARTHERTTRRIVDELSEDAPIRAEHGQARALVRAGHLAAHTTVAAFAPLADGDVTHARLPTFRRTNSPSYRMPL